MDTCWGEDDLPSKRLRFISLAASPGKERGGKKKERDLTIPPGSPGESGARVQLSQKLSKIWLPSFSLFLLFPVAREREERRTKNGEKLYGALSFSQLKTTGENGGNHQLRKRNTKANSVENGHGRITNVSYMITPPKTVESLTAGRRESN